MARTHAAAPPTGVVTLLFTDVEGSTKLARTADELWPSVIAAHHAILRDTIEGAGGWVESINGDGFFAVFVDPGAAVDAAADAQRRLRTHAWPVQVGELRVRMGIHTGLARRNETGYVGLEVHRAARVGAAARGGQVLMTEPTMALLGRRADLEDLGEHRLKDFPEGERLFHLVLDGRRAAVLGQPNTLPVRPTNLPPDTRPLLGREPDLERVHRLLTDGAHRLITITGPGGIGKTRLATAASARLLEGHPGGVWLVRLESLGDAQGLPVELAAAMGVVQSPDGPLLDAIVARIGERPTLLVLDNVEHLLPAAAGLVGDLLDHAPALRVLATSQLPLQLAHEHAMQLGPLPPAETVELFRLRARIGGGEPPDDGNESLMQAICSRLDGNPLAIELAAARARVLEPRQLLERLSDAFAVLRGGSRDLPDRQRSLRATVEWTLQLLEPAPAELFCRLGVFAGPVPLELIESVCDEDDLDVVDGLGVLLDASVVRRVEARDEPVCFDMPSPLRQLARERLEASAQAGTHRRRHAEALCRMAQAARWHPFKGRVSDLKALGALDADLAAAVSWAAQHDRLLHLRLAANLGAWWESRGRVAQAVEWLDAALASGADDDEHLGVAHAGLAWIQPIAGGPPAALEHADAAIELLARAGADEQRGVALLVRAWVLENLERLDEADADVAQSTAILVACGSAAVQAALLARIDHDIARGALDDAERRLGQLPAADPELPWADNAHTTHGDVALFRGDGRKAVRHYATALECALARRDRIQATLDMHGIAASLACAGQSSAALEAEALMQAYGDEMGVVSAPGGAYGNICRSHLARARADVGDDATRAIAARASRVPPAARVARLRELAAPNA